MTLIEPISQSANEIIGKISSSERGLFIGIMILFLLFSGFFMWNAGNNQALQRDAYLHTMERKDDINVTAINKINEITMNSIGRFTDALNKNTEVLTEIKAKIK